MHLRVPDLCITTPLTLFETSQEIIYAFIEGFYTSFSLIIQVKHVMMQSICNEMPIVDDRR
jgi:glucose uptake protein GlcU